MNNVEHFIVRPSYSSDTGIRFWQTKHRNLTHTIQPKPYILCSVERNPKNKNSYMYYNTMARSGTAELVENQSQMNEYLL